MFPGSDLSQIKDINEKILKQIALINFAINTNKTFKKRKFNEITMEEERKKKSDKLEKKFSKKLKLNDHKAEQGTLQMNTQNMNLFKETQKIENVGMGDEGTAFSIKMMGEKAIVKQAKKDNIEEIFISWK